MSQTETVRTPSAIPTAAEPSEGSSERIPWVDYAKGICILLVCMMHSTLGVGEAMHGEGFMHWAVAWARPFRMPDFFLLSGLFVAHTIDRPWRTYLDRKVVYFAYFYGLWLLVQSAVRYGPMMIHEPAAAAGHIAYALVYPFPPLWFIYVLPIYFVATKLARGMPLWGLIGLAALLHTVKVNTGWPAIDVFAAHYYVFFLVGYAVAPLVFRYAQSVAAHPHLALLGLPVWALINGLLAFTPSRVAGYPVIADLPGVSIAIGLVGAGAVVTLASLLARFRLASFIRYCGRHSLIIYVAFMLPMAATRVALVKSGLIASVGLVSVLVIAAAVLVPLTLHRLVRRGPARFLFERPAWFTLEPRTSGAAVRRQPEPTSHPQQETLTMVRRPSIPVRLDKGSRTARSGITTLTAANQNVPFNTLIGDGSRSHVQFDQDGARRTAQLAGFRHRVAGLIGQLKDVIAGKPPLVEPPVIVDLKPHRLAQAIRSRR